ncbi:MAG: peptidoglycan-binding domain-containing protein [Pseudomonadota bacterium]
MPNGARVQARTRRLQARLATLGLYRGRTDGVAGPLTRQAVDRALAMLPAVPRSVWGWPADIRGACCLALLDEALEQTAGGDIALPRARGYGSGHPPN